ncbi:MAG TPA: hypothetical protein DCE44_10545 [Verrucomicrobiales bacterium]|nr:hypothetical protein [Verrucomicrobiales bacterium]
MTRRDFLTATALGSSAFPIAAQNDTSASSPATRTTISGCRRRRANPSRNSSAALRSRNTRPSSRARRRRAN